MRTSTRSARRRDDHYTILAGCIGLAAAAYVACGGDDAGGTQGETSDGGNVADASAGDDAALQDGGTADAARAGEGGSTTTLTCTSSTATAQNTADVVAAASTLLAALTTAQQTTIQLEATAANAEQWSNLPTDFIPRNGVMLGDMSSAAQAAAVTLVTVAAGSTGATLFSELRAADEYLVTNGKASSSSYGGGRYYIAFVGAPSTTSAWQLQVAGHHLAYNVTYNGRCTSATPLFDGVEPTTWTDTASHAPLEAQRAASVAVIAAIASNADAVLSGTFSDVVNGPTNSGGKGDTKYQTLLSYPTGTTGRGVNVGSLDASGQQLVKTAIEAWVKNVADPVSTVILADYESRDALAQTYVAYSGAKDLTTQNSYFRIDGPRVWIEYTIQGGIIYQGRVHYHTLWRDKEADYGAEYAGAEGSAGSGGTTGPGGAGGPPSGDGGPPNGGNGTGGP